MIRPGGAALRLLVAAVLVCAAMAQESRPDPARRLHDLVDRRIEALRAELHREIDLALAPPDEILGMKLRPASAEFRQLHRLPTGCGLRVENGPVTIKTGNGVKFLVEKGDVLVESDGPIGRASDLRRFDQYGTLSSHGLTLIRKGEWLSWNDLEPDSARRVASKAALLTPPEPQETASQLVDRLWDETLQNVIKKDPVELPINRNVAESQPVRK